MKKNTPYKRLIYILILIFISVAIFHKPTSQKIQTVFHNHMKNNGFGVHDVILYGRTNAKKAEILAKTKITYGQSIFSINITKIKQNLESLGWIKSVAVERQFPNRINIKIVERNPIAIWKYNKKLYLIDRDGIIITNKNIGKFSNLKSVGGKNSNKKVIEFLNLIATDKALSQIVTEGVYVSNRRWNLIVLDKLTIKLPAIAPEKAWKILGKYAREKNLFARPISIIDMRVPKKIFIKLRKDKQNKT